MPRSQLIHERWPARTLGRLLESSTAAMLPSQHLPKTRFSYNESFSKTSFSLTNHFCFFHAFKLKSFLPSKTNRYFHDDTSDSFRFAKVRSSSMEELKTIQGDQALVPTPSENISHKRASMPIQAPRSRRRAGNSNKLKKKIPKSCNNFVFH